MKKWAILQVILLISVQIAVYNLSLAIETTSQRASTAPGERFEFASGGGAGRQVWSGYGSLTWAFGNPVAEDGFRARFTAGGSRYSFTTLAEGDKGGVLPVVNVAQSMFGDALAGYQAHRGPLWLKFFVGVEFDDHAFTVPAFVPVGQERMALGPVGAVEAWLLTGESSWLSVNSSYSLAAGAYSAELRLGSRPLDFKKIGLDGLELDLGPEAGAEGDDQAQGGRFRAGGFLKLNYRGVETTVSGGLSEALPGLVSGNSEGASGYYGNLAIFRRF